MTTKADVLNARAVCERLEEAKFQALRTYRDIAFAYLEECGWTQAIDDFNRIKWRRTPDGDLISFRDAIVIALEDDKSDEQS